MTPIPQNTMALPVLPLAGLHLDTLGHYFAALGLLRLAARQWPTVKGCWRDGVFHLVGGPKDLSELETFMFNIGANNKWTQYTLGWAEEQKKDTKDKTAANVSLWRANQTSEAESAFTLSHLATAERLRFNPVFGTGGNAGKRNFSKGWEKARDAVKAVTPKTKKSKKKTVAAETPSLLPSEMPSAAKQDLSAFLNGNTCSLLSDYGAACWFSDANKKYNFSPDSPFREGQITPWAMLLACEAFPLLVGATSRQFGSTREGTGAFPFVTKGTAPENEKEVETLTGEFWAPVWSKPLSVAEVSALYKRGRAEVNGRGAITSAAFAAAIIQRGTDAGLAEFRRFSLLHTTSAQTFESRLASVHSLAAIQEANTAQADAVSSIIRFRDALPREFKKGKSWVYRGLQGPIDTALVCLSASGNNDDLLREYSWALLDAVFASLKKTANNKTYREREPALQLLPVSWVVSLLQKERALTPEIRIALALATLQAETRKQDSSSDTDRKRGLPAPFLAYRVGVVPAWKNNWRKVKIAKNTPLRVEWSERPLTENLIAVIRRRVAVEAEIKSEPPFKTQLTLPIADVFAFLNNETDEATLARWLDRFLLFDWSFLQTAERNAISAFLRLTGYGSAGGLHAAEAVLCFLQPLFHACTFTRIQPEPKSSKTPTAGMLRPFVALLERGDVIIAFSAAQGRYKSLLIETADFGKPDFTLSDSDSRRLLATLLLPALPTAVAKHFSRFQLTKPSNKKQKP
jgi:CRISPR-associated protein Csx17